MKGKRRLVLHAFYLAREDIWLELSHTLTTHAAALARGRLSIFAVYFKLMHDCIDVINVAVLTFTTPTHLYMHTCR